MDPLLGIMDGETEVWRRGGVHQLGQTGDEGNVARFEWKGREMGFLSRQEGRQICKDVVMIFIRGVGSKQIQPHEVKFASEEDFKAGRDKDGFCQRFPVAWQAFYQDSEVGRSVRMWL